MSEAVGEREPQIVSKARLEFLCDGIFAIAMTLLVLELKVPEIAERRSVAALAAALRPHLPGFASYLLSFSMLAIFWTNHNQWYRHIQRLTKPILVLQLGQLALAAFFPFCAALVGRYPTNRLGLVVYLSCVTGYLWLGALLWVIARHSHALAPAPDGALYGRIQRGQIVGSSVATLMLAAYLAIGLTG